MPAPLVTLADYKTYKKLTKTDSDAELNLLITSVSALVKTYLGHSLIDYYSTPKVEVFNIARNTNTLQLNDWPINQVISVEARTTYSDTYTLYDPSEYQVDTYTDSIYKHLTYWPEGFGAVKVTYTAGYPATPDDIKLATLDLINHYHKEEYKEGKSIGNATINNNPAGFSRTAANSTEWPSHIQRVLSMYKNV